jgi:hypothetical protein
VPIDFDDKEPSVKLEAVERRGEPRGVVRDVTVTIGGLTLPAVEASRKGFFVTVDDPETYRLGDSHDIRVHRGDHTIGCRVEVVRKEIDPRVGVALRIAHISPVAEESLREMLGH